MSLFLYFHKDNMSTLSNNEGVHLALNIFKIT